MRGSNSKPLQILSKRQRRAPTCSQSARKMLTKHANARFPGPMSSRARGSISKVLQMLKNYRHVRSCFQTVARATKKPDVPVFFMPYIFLFWSLTPYDHKNTALRVLHVQLSCTVMPLPPKYRVSESFQEVPAETALPHQISNDVTWVAAAWLHGLQRRGDYRNPKGNPKVFTEFVS